ncbi:MAG TPA: ABC transporter permease [Bryobacteraceae bacterium]|nr:ABC transporter permease [Bryobacteraceae bacterium]
MLPSIRHALRVLRKDPGFTGVAICSLSLGIGATAAMFSFADAMLLRPLPIGDPGRVVAINTTKPAPFGMNSPISYPDYADLRERNRTFEGVAAASYAFFGFSPNAATQPRMKWGLYVSGNLFRVLGVEPSLGRGFRPDEDQVEGRDPVVVLGHDFWVGQFGASPSVVGSRIRLNGIEFTVIGVAPEHFTGIDLFMRPHVFVPLAMSSRMTAQNYLHDRDLGFLFLKGRLKPGVSLEQAQADVAALAGGLEKLHSHPSRDQLLRVETETQFRIAQGPSQMIMTAMLLLLSFCVLVVACANVASLLLSRARARTREIAVRLAIGAGRAALVRQLLIENVLVALGGGLGGVLVAYAMGEFWHSFPIPSDVPVAFDAGVNPRVLIFTLAVSIFSTLLFGLAPALRATHPDLVPALKSADADSGGRRRLWGRNAIVAGQVALSLLLLAISAALVQGFRDQLLPGPGYRTDQLYLTSFDTQLVHDSENRSSRFFHDLLDRVRLAPGVRSAAVSSTVPMQDAANSVGVVPDGWQLPRGEYTISTFCGYVSDGYFATMNIPILHGREFLETDRDNTPLVAVVNQQMANHFWKGNALGRRFHLGTADGPLVQIVGVAKKCKYIWIAEPPIDYVYLPFRQHPTSKASLIAESESRDAASLAPVLRAEVRKLDPDMPVFDQRTMYDLYTQRAVKTSNIIVQLVAGMGLIGMILAAVGLYGLVAYSVSRRTREIGIRMALGADRGSVVRMILRQGLLLGLAGVAVGLAAAFYVCPLVTSALSFFAFTHVDPLVFVAIPLLLLFITALATWVPARRASLVDPLTSLHDE